MSDLIRLLPDAIANQIAAGEVVQRPASVVKELIENSLDAGATQITLVVRDAGRTLIQVVDNGIGMSETDARLCFERHATSKIKTAEDLYAVRTMGFRGEAMASIAAVARCELLTRLHTEELGTELIIEASQIKALRPAACPEGTRISVKNLFFNTPARRNFLKSNASELRHIIEEVTRCALARPDVGFTVFRDEAEFMRLAPAKLPQRIAALLGRAYPEGLVPVGEQTSIFNISGYLGKVELARKTRGEQYFFVNNRFIRHPYLHRAISQAFEGLLPQDYFPFYCIFIETDPARIDVNVHPTKTEVKFEQESALYGVMLAAARKALSEFHVLPPLDFEGGVNYGLDFENRMPQGNPQPAPGFGGGPPPVWPPMNNSHTTLTPQPAWGSHIPDDFLQSLTGNPGHPFSGGARILPPLQTEDGEVLLPITAQARLAADGQAGALFQFAGRYLASALKNGLLLVDIEAARERIYFEKFMARGPYESVSLQSVFPVTIDFSATDMVVLEDIWDELHRLGFTLTLLGPTAVQVAGIPPEARQGSEAALLQGLLEQYRADAATLRLTRHEVVARSMATRAARLAAGRTLEAGEMQMLVNRLFACAVPNLTPGGRPVTVMLSAETIAGWMGE